MFNKHPEVSMLLQVFEYHVQVITFPYLYPKTTQRLSADQRDGCGEGGLASNYAGCGV